VVTGLVPIRNGSVRLFGEEVAGLGRTAIARKVAVVPQEVEVAYGFSVREVVAMGRAPHQGGWMRASPEDDAIVRRTLDEHDLRSLADRSARDLSGGEKKRVAIARAFCQTAPVVLLDEPTASLDVKHQLALFELLTARVKDGLGCIVVLHDLNLAAQFATRIVLMKEGRILADGKIEDVMTWARLKEAFDADLYCGVNELTGTRFFLPQRAQLVSVGTGTLQAGASNTPLSASPESKRTE
jgi:iron complex transport system ATP-binding protein